MALPLGAHSHRSQAAGLHIAPRHVSPMKLIQAETSPRALNVVLGVAVFWCKATSGPWLNGQCCQPCTPHTFSFSPSLLPSLCRLPRACPKGISQSDSATARAASHCTAKRGQSLSPRHFYSIPFPYLLGVSRHLLAPPHCPPSLAPRCLLIHGLPFTLQQPFWSQSRLSPARHPLPFHPQDHANPTPQHHWGPASTPSPSICCPPPPHFAAGGLLCSSIGGGSGGRSNSRSGAGPKAAASCA